MPTDDHLSSKKPCYLLVAAMLFSERSANVAIVLAPIATYIVEKCIQMQFAQSTS